MSVTAFNKAGMLVIRWRMQADKCHNSRHSTDLAGFTALLNVGNALTDCANELEGVLLSPVEKTPLEIVQREALEKCRGLLACLTSGYFGPISDDAMKIIQPVKGSVSAALSSGVQS